MITNNIIEFVAPAPKPPNCAGISVSKYSSNGMPPIVELTSDSIVNFSGPGVFLSSISTQSSLCQNKIKHNDIYGIYVLNSSPEIKGTNSSDYNAICFNQIGVYYDANSGGKVRWAKIKENYLYGVKVESHNVGRPLPDFGTLSDWGYNSIHKDNPCATCYDMTYSGQITGINAQGNWWGELDPFVSGPINLIPIQANDPLPGFERRSVNSPNLPMSIVLDQNYPNPFNPTTKMSFYLTQSGNAELKIYDLNGRLVKIIASGYKNLGKHTVTWDGKNSAGEDISSGIYFYMLSTDFGKEVKRMTLLR